MLAVGIWLGVLGYAVFYWGEQLATGSPTTFAEAFGMGGGGSG